MNSSWQKVTDILKNGGVIIIPSDSVYGIAALASNNLAEKLTQKYWPGGLTIIGEAKKNFSPLISASLLCWPRIGSSISP